MNLSVFNIIIIIFLGIILGYSNTRRNRNVYIFIMMLVFLLEAALRHPTVGMDTEAYIIFFNKTKEMSWGDLWIKFIDRYFGYGELEEDVGYSLLTKLLSSFVRDWNLFEFIRDLFFFIPMGLYLKKYSTDFYQLVFGMLFYASLVHSIPMNGGRQLLSLGFGILAFIDLQDKHYWKSSVWILIGSLMHASCLLCFLIMLCSLLDHKNIKRLHIVSLLLIPVVLLNINSIIVFMGEAIGSERYAQYGIGTLQGGAATFIVLMELLSIFCFFAISSLKLQENRTLKVFYATIIGTTLFSPLIWSNGAMIRVVMYFYIYLTLLLPFAIDSIMGARDRRMVYIVFILLLGGLMAFNSKSNYLFYWQ